MSEEQKENKFQEPLMENREEVPINGHEKVTLKSVWGNFSCKGRASRLEFWYFYLPFIFLCAVSGVLAYSTKFISIGIFVFLLVMLFVQFFLFVRRLHDIGFSGYWSLLFLLVPLAPALVVIMPLCAVVVYIDIIPFVILSGASYGACFLTLGCIGSQGGTNQYGDNPNDDGEDKWNLIQKIRTFSLRSKRMIYCGFALLFLLPSAILLILRAAERSTPENQYTMGCNALRTLSGAGAAEWFRKAAEQGHMESQYNLGICYRDGIGGVREKTAEAVKWFRKAAEQGHSESQYLLGTWLFEKSAFNDKDEAVKWLRKAAEQGNAGAQCNLGVIYYREKQNSRNSAITEQEIAELFRKAAEQGNANAQHNLSSCYEHGFGVEQDSAKAHDWKRKADETERENMLKELKNRQHFFRN